MVPSTTNEPPRKVSSKSLQNGNYNKNKILERPFGTKQRMRIVIIGAGVSGINFFKKAEEQMENIDIVCYEKNDDVGGTVG
jgi:hypothetical protein